MTISATIGSRRRNWCWHVVVGAGSAEKWDMIDDNKPPRATHTILMSRRVWPVRGVACMSRVTETMHGQMHLPQVSGGISVTTRNLSEKKMRKLSWYWIA